MAVLTLSGRLLRSLSSTPTVGGAFSHSSPSCRAGLSVGRQLRLSCAAQEAGARPATPTSPYIRQDQTFHARPFGNGPGRGGGRGGGGGRGRGRGRPPIQNQRTVPINDEIRCPEVRLLGEERETMGVYSTEEALAIARDASVDLVMVVPDANPPVCRLIEYSKYNYELLKAAKDAKKKQREAIVETKEVKLRPATDVHDYQTKVRAASKFLSKGARVKLTVQFKGREMEFKEIGREMFARFVEDLGGDAEVSIEQPAQMQGRQMTMVLASKKELIA